MAGMQGHSVRENPLKFPGVQSSAGHIYNCPYEVGDILQTLNTSSPEDRWPGTEWEAITGRVLVGLDSTQTEFDTAGERGRRKSAYTTSPDAQRHSLMCIREARQTLICNRRTPAWISVNGQGEPTIRNRQGGSAHNNLQPYKVVYMWLRTGLRRTA